MLGHRIYENGETQAENSLLSSSEDLVEKGQAFYQKTQEYMHFPNVKFWYRSEPDSEPVLTARIHSGEASVLDQDGFDRLLVTHELEGEASASIIRNTFGMSD